MSEREDDRDSKDRDVSREYADELGRRERDAGTKGWDGSDLNEADARLYGLRKSGYKGWIDRDGYMPSGTMW